MITIAAGATRYDNLTNAGGVFFMEFHNNANDLSENLLLDEQKMRLRGDGFLGAGFGYSLATADLDGNG